MDDEQRNTRPAPPIGSVEPLVLLPGHPTTGANEMSTYRVTVYFEANTNEEARERVSEIRDIVGPLGSVDEESLADLI